VALRVRNLWVRYGRLDVLRGLDVEVPPGRVYLLMGPNGAGKTTLLRAVLGWAPVTAGQIEVDGLSPSVAPRDVRSRVGFLPEVVQLYGELTVAQHLRLFARLHGFSGDLGDILRQAGIEEAWLSRRVALLSKGMCQRVALGILLTKEVTTFLLDEPTTGLDPPSAWDWAHRVRRLAHERGWAVLVTTHQLEHWVELADDVGFLADGRIEMEFRPRSEGLERLLTFWRSTGSWAGLSYRSNEGQVTSNG